MANELLEKLKAAKDKEEISAILEKLKKEKEELSADDLDGVTGGASAEGADLELLKEAIILCAENDMVATAISLLKDYFGIDYSLIRQAKISICGSDVNLIKYIVDQML